MLNNGKAVLEATDTVKIKKKPPEKQSGATSASTILAPIIEALKGALRKVAFITSIGPSKNEQLANQKEGEIILPPQMEGYQFNEKYLEMTGRIQGEISKQRLKLETHKKEFGCFQNWQQLNKYIKGKGTKKNQSRDKEKYARYEAYQTTYFTTEILQELLTNGKVNFQDCAEKFIKKGKNDHEKEIHRSSLEIAYLYVEEIVKNL